MKTHDLWPSIGIKYDASGLTLFIYSSSFFRKFGSLPFLVQGSVGILVLIRNLIRVMHYLVLFKLHYLHFYVSYSFFLLVLDCRRIYVLDKVDQNIQSMAFIYCKKCGEYRYLTPHAFWNISNLGVKCKNCGTINTITIENGELKKLV